jgi:hypothetical protein
VEVSEREEEGGRKKRVERGKGEVSIRSRGRRRRMY